MAMFEVRRTGGDLQRISRELRKIDDKELKKRFRQQLRATAAPLVPVVRASIRSTPSSRPYTPAGLRGRLSKATRIEVKTVGRDAQVSIRVDGRKMPAHQKALPKGMEGKKRWRHPVYGHRGNWVTQPARPYFFHVVRPAGVAARVAAQRVVRSITRDIK
ncbi:hypothetical protein ACIQU5_32005 [Streptomyces sp. NPDC090306]|uniref:hypothetical protein n=1 Tax=Streptomyces sp. NPDC090306 TaxID=3365961 RepID=UPI0037F4B3F4